MSATFTPTTRLNCGRGFDLANPWNELNPSVGTAR